ncbi:MAG TPA: HAMP domain-containing sensor histidine kinase [Taishania sp.]|nr:HAMP domain-containing sensor histidine kinase [Taishania sp.]
MKKSTTLLFYFLSIYLIVQFIWWGYHIIDLSDQIAGDSPNATKRMVMILGEGTVFLAIVIFGIFRIRRSIRKELEFSRNQNNFLLSITHELKTPIASTRLYLQTLQKRNLPEEKREEILQKTLMQNEQLERLIDNILNASRLESKRLVLHKDPLNLSDFLTAILERYQRLYTSITFINNIEPDISDDADPFIIETIVNNLIENAIKYGGQEGTITLELEKTNRIHIRVKDCGQGIPLTYQKDVFKKFFRIGNEETRTQKGSGLGLFIVKQLAQLHNGSIKYYQNQPTGSVFELTL